MLDKDRKSQYLNPLNSVLSLFHYPWQGTIYNIILYTHNIKNCTNISTVHRSRVFLYNNIRYTRKLHVLKINNPPNGVIKQKIAPLQNIHLRVGIKNETTKYYYFMYYFVRGSGGRRRCESGATALDGCRRRDRVRFFLFSF